MDRSKQRADDQKRLSPLADEILNFIATKNLNFKDFKIVWDMVIRKSFKRFKLD